MTSTFSWRVAHRGALLSMLVASSFSAGPAAAADLVDLGQAVPEVKAISDGLFPEDACKELQEAGFKCMGFKPAVRFSLPAAAFKLGSAELPDLLRQQLDRFAEAMRGKRGSGRVVRIEGHADATGSDEINGPLSQKRAQAVKDYLVKAGTDQTMLQAVGVGAKDPKDKSDPRASENRRVEIGRLVPP